MLVTLKEILQEAERTNTAVGAFNTPCFESLVSVIETAEKLGLPVIVEHAEVHFPYAPLKQIGPAMVDYACRASVPVCVHLDHGTSLEAVKEALNLGFTSVMYDASALPYEDNVKSTRQVAAYVHQQNASVEAELGSVGLAGSSQGNYTDPEQAKDFVKRTGVDALAIAFGTAHGIYARSPSLNYDVIAEVREAASLPLVMHGGSGVSDDDYKKVIQLGIRKINYYSYMGAAAYQKAAEYIDHSQGEGHLFQELSWEAQKVFCSYVERSMKLFSNLPLSK